MASDSESSVVTSLKENNMITVEQVMSAVKTLETSDLFKLLKTTSAEVEKRSKTAAKAGAGKATARAQQKKTGSMPKGAIPPQLKKPRAWVEFTLKDALENGWESFTVVQKKKDKETNTVTEEQIEMPGSVLHDGAHVYKDSVTKEKPAGKQLIHKEAMSLSKQRKESSHSSYSLFESSYVDTPSDDDKSDAGSSTASKKIVVKKTAAEKEAEAAVKKAEKAAEAAAKKEAKALETAAKKEAKALEAAAKKAEKEAEKEAKKAEKETSKSVVKAPVAAVKKAAPAPAPAPTPAPAEPVAEKPVAKKPTRKVAKVEDVPNDGMVHPWTYKGTKYLRNADGETWTVGADGGMGNWVGVYDAKAGLIKGAPEPVFDNDDE